MFNKFHYLAISTVIVWLLSASIVWAEAWEALFPEARLMSSTSSEDSDYRLALGPLKKVNNNWLFQREQTLTGELQRHTLELGEKLSVDEAHQRLRNALVRRGARPLYTCEGLDCGSSNAWANVHFEVKQLYGLDQHQYYGAWEVPGENDESYYLATYVVQRGNRRVYMQIDQLQVPAAEQGAIVATAATLVESLRKQRYFVLSGVKVTTDSISVERKHLEVVVDALRHDPWLKIRIVGHDYGPGDLKQQQQRSENAAQQVRKALIDSNIKPERVTAHGVGSLAPAGKRGDTRVEIVLAQ